MSPPPRAATLAAALVAAVVLVAAAPAAADAVAWPHLGDPRSARLASGPSSFLAESNLKQVGGLGGESWWAYDLGWHGYGYSLNNPLRLVDPNGETPGEAFHGFLQGFVGAVLFNAPSVTQPSPNDAIDQRSGQILGATVVAAIGAKLSLDGTIATGVGGALTLATAPAGGEGAVVGAPLAGAGLVSTTAGGTLMAGATVYLSNATGQGGAHDARHKEQVKGDTQDLIEKEQEIKKAYKDQAAGKTKQRIKDRMWEEAQDALNPGGSGGGD